MQYKTSLGNPVTVRKLFDYMNHTFIMHRSYYTDRVWVISEIRTGRMIYQDTKPMSESISIFKKELLKVGEEKLTKELKQYKTVNEVWVNLTYLTERRKQDVKHF